MQNSKIKWLYEFDQEFDVAGKVVKKTLAILKPNRKLRESGELFYSAEISKFAKAGVLPRAAWSTILSNSGGTISDQDREQYGKLLIDFRDKSLRTQQLMLKGILTGAEKSELKTISEDLEAIRTNIQSFETDQVNIFENTAEAKARNKSILWWVLNLAYEKNSDGSYQPIVSGDTYDQKIEAYDKIEEDDPDSLAMLILSKMVYYVTLWFIGRANKQEDFELYRAQIEDKKEPASEAKESEEEPLKSDNEESTEDEGFLPEKISE